MTEREEILQLKKELTLANKKYDSKPFCIEGEVAFINPKEDKSTTVGKNFYVREICLKVTDFVNGQEYSHVIGFQFTGNACDLVESNGIGIGDTVKLFFAPKGNVKDSQKMVQDPAKPGSPYPLNPESKTCFTNLNVYKVEGVYIAEPNRYKVDSTVVNKPVDTNNKAELKAQPEGEVPLDATNKPMIWNGETGEWQVDDLPF